MKKALLLYGIGGGVLIAILKLPFPVGLIVTLISAAVLRRKPRSEPTRV